MTIATVKITQIRPSVDVEWYRSSEAEQAYYESKYSTLTRTLKNLPEEPQKDENGAIIAGSSLVILKRERVIKGENPLITEYFNELNDSSSILYVNRITHFVTNGIQYEITYSED